MTTPTIRVLPLPQVMVYPCLLRIFWTMPLFTPPVRLTITHSTARQFYHPPNLPLVCHTHDPSFPFTISKNVLQFHLVLPRLTTHMVLRDEMAGKRMEANRNEM
jgi:hypothetical protein